MHLFYYVILSIGPTYTGTCMVDGPYNNTKRICHLTRKKLMVDMVMLSVSRLFCTIYGRSLIYSLSSPFALLTLRE